MNRINELIKKMCPNGVEYKTLDKVCSVTTGNQLNKDKLLDEAEYPVINGGINPSGYWHEYNTDKNTITISQGGASAGYVNYMETPFWAGAHCYVVKLEEKKVNYRYLYHYIKSIEKKLQKCQQGAGIPSVSRKNIYENCIPVPPLEVQCEIVHILDDFTLLSAELSAELKARQKQYEYYRNEMLNCSENVKKVKFGDVAKIQRGASPRPISQFITDNEDGVNWIKIGDVAEGKKYITHCKEKITIEGAKKSRFVKKGDFILSNSMSFGRPYILDINGCIHDGWLSISDFKKYYLSDFLYHLLNSNDIQDMFKQKASFGGAVQNLNADIVRNIELPLIPLDEQQKIVNVLDKFEIYCNDISEGLPAEIEARKKQYEYYRDKLLNFKELKVEE